ncbi:MAG: PIG-L family deacetylase [Candidatus Nitrosopolaris sp.]|jgi:LmbE family N-acetylglucosaminyl deacetylase
MNILAIGAHPDDIELGCGGLLLKAVKQGHNIWMYTLTRGEASGDPTQRTCEQIEAAKFIGADTLWIDGFEDTKLSLNAELIRRIESVIKYSHADVVYTHPMGDTHHDHRAVAEATLEAGRFVSNILSYEIAVTKDFKPHVYYDISDVMDDKVELLSVFSSQQHKMFICKNATKGLAQYRALQSRLHPLVTSVEAFEVLKLGLGVDFQLLTAHYDDIRSTADYKNQLPLEILEWRREELQEKPVISR